VREQLPRPRRSSALIAAAKEALDSHGFEMASVRFICGTQDIHKDLRGRAHPVSRHEDTILYPSAFDANGGLFERFSVAEDAIISDELNHASIIDGIRLCKAHAFVTSTTTWRSRSPAREKPGTRAFASSHRRCFSMDGTICRSQCHLRSRRKILALTMIDDAHATGFPRAQRSRHHEYRGVMDRIDIITARSAKRYGGAAEDFTSARNES